MKLLSYWEASRTSPQAPYSSAVSGSVETLGAINLRVQYSYSRLCGVANGDVGGKGGMPRMARSMEIASHQREALHQNAQETLTIDARR